MGREAFNDTGSSGEAAVASELLRSGFHVFTPAFCCPEIDMIVERNGKLLRIQVKSSSVVSDKIRFRTWRENGELYGNRIDWFAFHSTHYGVTAWMKPEEASIYPTLRYDSPDREAYVSNTMRYAADFSIDRVIKETEL